MLHPVLGKSHTRNFQGSQKMSRWLKRSKSWRRGSRMSLDNLDQQRSLPRKRRASLWMWVAPLASQPRVPAVQTLTPAVPASLAVLLTRVTQKQVEQEGHHARETRRTTTKLRRHQEWQHRLFQQCPLSRVLRQHCRWSREVT